MDEERIIVRLAIPADVMFAEEIIQEIESSALRRGFGVLKRSAASVIEKIESISSAN